MHPTINRYLLYTPITFIRNQPVARVLKELRATQWCTPKQIRAAQLQKLVRLVRFAKDHVPHYRRSLARVVPERLTSLRDIDQLPILTRDDLKERFRDLLAPWAYGRVCKITGGSTGNPVTVVKSRTAAAFTYAAYFRGYEWAGVALGERQGRFWGIRPKLVDRLRARFTDVVMNRRTCSAFGYSEENLHEYYCVLNRFRPSYLYGYVSILDAFADFMIERGLRLKEPLKCIIATSEVLSDVQRDKLEFAFTCRVFNEYGCGEVGTIAHECAARGLHISAERLIVETLHGGQPTTLGSYGEVVITDLLNYAMPLIRYNVKDVASISDASCVCGRSLPLVREVCGRALDTIYAKNGTEFHGMYFSYLFQELQKQGASVRGFQVIQNKYDHLIIQVVAPSSLRILENFLKERLRATFGPELCLTIECVTHIPREPSGKVRLTKSLLPKNVTTSATMAR